MIQASAPTDSQVRIRSLDALRGVALLGIGIANIRQIFWPWDLADNPIALNGNEQLAWIDWFLYSAFVESKFITLFSLLFGIGFAIQTERLNRPEHGLVRVYVRRILLLALFGLIHGLFLYPAEVLLPYAATALMLLVANRLSPQSLLKTGFVLLGTALLWGYQIGALGDLWLTATAAAIFFQSIAMAILWRKHWRWALGIWGMIILGTGLILTLQSASTEGGSSLAEEYSGNYRLLQAIHANDQEQFPDELAVRRSGGWIDLIELHASQYAAVLFYFAILLAWRTLGLFMIGAGLYRSNAFALASHRTWNQIAGLGLAIGIPLSLVATWLTARAMNVPSTWHISEFLHDVSAPVLAAGYAGLVFSLQPQAGLQWFWRPVEAAGRMALTNYVGQSLVMAALAESWGAGWYAQVNGPTLTLMALGIYIGLAMLSQFWLTQFRWGPLEWLWRCGTYWRWLPLRSNYEK